MPSPQPAAIILAAGESRRMGSPKALLVRGAKTFFEEAVDAVYTPRVRWRIAVVNPAIVPELSGKEKLGALIENHEPQLGQLHSLKLALRWLIENALDAGGALILLVDNPGDLRERVALLLDNLGDGHTPVVAAFSKREGHPLWLPRRLWQGALAYDGPDGLRGFLSVANESPRRIETHLPSTLHDIDTPEDLPENV